MAPTWGRAQVLQCQKSDLLMVWIKKQLCFCRKHSSSHLGFHCQTQALIFHGKRRGQELFLVFNLKVQQYLRNREKSWEGFKAVVANIQSFSALNSFILGVECSQLRGTQNNLIFLCPAPAIHGISSSNSPTPGPGFVPVSREGQSKPEQKIQNIPALQAQVCVQSGIPGLPEHPVSLQWLHSF